MEVRSNDLSSGWSGEAWRASWAFVVENRLPAFVVAVLVPAVVASIQFNWRSPEMKTALITAVWTLVVYFVICLSVYLFFLLYRVPKGRLVAAEKIIREKLANIETLEERLRPKFDVAYKEDGRCNLRASPDNYAHFRVWLTLRGTEIAKHLIATVMTIRKDGDNLELSENIRLRFHNAKHGADELEAMNPGAEELLDIFRLDNGLSLANARVYNSFNSMSATTQETLTKSTYRLAVLVRDKILLSCAIGLVVSIRPSVTSSRLR